MAKPTPLPDPPPQGGREAPADAAPEASLRRIPLVPLRDDVVFPKLIVPLSVGRRTSIAAITAAMDKDKQVLLVAQKDPQVDDTVYLADLVSAAPDQTLEQKQHMLETPNVLERLRLLALFLSKQVEILELKAKIQNEVQSTIGKLQRDQILREQLKAIRKELGEDEEGQDLHNLREKIEAAGMPDAVKERALKEVDRMQSIPAISPAVGIIRTYVDWLVALPWGMPPAEACYIKLAAKVLDEDHYGVEKIKERILEYMAVRQRSQSLRSPILCFVGPPGVGKTSLGKSIARALGRKFVRLSLGGIHDEAEIRGHRRTYIGAMPGRILQQMKVAGARNPVFMLDEIDKVGADWRGDPSSAVLEGRNPEREIANICRKIPRRIAEGQTEKILVKPEDLLAYIGPSRFEFGVAELEDQVGAVTGVAVNEYGGDVMTVEAIAMEGKGEFALTGQIGKVMEESARAAVSYARAHAEDLGIKPEWFDEHFFHIHVPAGAIPKDGPSAGITMASAVVSVLTDRPVRRDVAMTGEITLRGKVLPIGGLKEKLLAAHRAGIKTFILPDKNRKDLHEVPDEVKQSMELVLVKHVDEVLEKALLPATPRAAGPGLGFRRPLGDTQPGTVN